MLGMLVMLVISWTYKQDGGMELRTCNTIIFKCFPTLDHRLSVAKRAMKSVQHKIINSLKQCEGFLGEVVATVILFCDSVL